MEEGKEGQLLRDGNKPSFLQKHSVNGDDTTMQPEDYRTAALLAVLCFLPTGLLSLCHSWKAQRLYREGDVVGSEYASRRTRRLVILTRRISLVFWLGLLLLVAAGLVLGLCFGIDANKH